MSDDAPGPGRSEPPPVPVLRLALLLLGPPLLFLTVLAVRYALASFACGSGAARAALEIVAAFGLAATGGAALLGWSRARVPATAGHDGAATPHTLGFLTLLALASALLFTLLFVALWLPSWIIDPCAEG